MKYAVLLFFSLSMFIQLTMYAQTVRIVKMASLPEIVNESSGIETNTPGTAWTHNDSGDLPRIFKFDTLGNLLRTVYLSTITAMDMEEMARDEDGNLYIGDFGNNLNSRQDLRIYKIPDPELLPTDSVIPQVIRFSYPDQHTFPPSAADQNFDCEAMFHFQDSLYLFSKNRGTSSFCKMYRLPDQPGNYVAELTDSFNTVKWITSADISPSGKSMVLLSYDRLWLFTAFDDTHFFNGQALKLAVDSTQKEAFVFINDTVAYITDEKFMALGGNLYSADLTQWINSMGEYPDASNAIRILPNPTPGRFLVEIEASQSGSVITELMSQNGQIFYQNRFSLCRGWNKFPLALAGVPAGTYLLRFRFGQGFETTRKLVVR